jgi:hypothetical protein
MKEIDAIAQEARNQFNTPTIAYLCPKCKTHLAYLSAGPDRLGLTGEKAIKLELQINENFVWSKKENCFLRPKNFDGKRPANRDEKKELEKSLHKSKQQLANDGWTPETKAEVEAFAARLSELPVGEQIRLKEVQAELIAANPSLYDLDRSRFKKEMNEDIQREEKYLAELSSKTWSGPIFLDEGDLLVQPEKGFLCCGRMVRLSVLPRAQFVLDETKANPTPRVAPDAPPA